MTVDGILALLSLTALEIVLGIDNIVFVAILVGKLPEHQRKWVRQLGLFLAMFIRILLLLTISWVMQLTTPLFTALSHSISGRDLILIGGGLFLIGKATYEIHEKMEHASSPELTQSVVAKSVGLILFQILILDIVFSLDSVITAVGMTPHIPVMITAIVISVIVMMIFSGAISRFIEKHPTLKMLALSFLILVGVMLLMEGLGKHVDKGYIYFAMGYALLVESLNIRAKGKGKVITAQVP